MATIDNKRIMGTSSALIAAICLALMGVLTHQSRDSLTLGDVVVWRSALMVVVTVPFILKTYKHLFTSTSLPLWIRSVTGSAAMILYLKTLQMGHVGIGNSLAILTQVFVPVLAFFFLKERFSMLNVMGLVVIVGPVLYLHSGVLEDLNRLTVTLGLLGAFLASISFVFLRRAAQVSSPYLIVFVVSVFSLFGGLFFEPQFESVASLVRNEYLWGIGGCALVMQFAMTYAYKYLEASRALVINETFIIWAALLQFFMFDEQIFVGEMLSYFAIVAGVMLVQVRGKRAID